MSNDKKQEFFSQNHEFSKNPLTRSDRKNQDFFVTFSVFIEIPQLRVRSWAKNYITSRVRKVREIKTFTIFSQDPGMPLTDKNDLLQIQVLIFKKVLISWIFYKFL